MSRPGAILDNQPPDGGPIDVPSPAGPSDGGGTAEVPGTGLLVSAKEAGNPLISLPDFLCEETKGELDLSAWFPPARSQGRQNSCVGWVLGYALKTYQEAREREWDPAAASHQFSPSFVFDRITKDCSRGATLEDGLRLLMDEGCLTIEQAAYDPDDCTGQAGDADLTAARPYRIKSFNQFKVSDVSQVKCYMSAFDMPVVVGIRVYPQFNRLGGPDATYDSVEGERLSGHAVVVVGYSDARQAFRVFNSFGPGWGDNGYAWISYSIWPDAILLGYVGQDDVVDCGGFATLCGPGEEFDEILLTARVGEEGLVVAGGVVTLVASAVGGTGPYKYVWRLGDDVIGTGETLSYPLPPGTHTLTLTVTDIGGSAVSSEVTVSVDPATAESTPTDASGSAETATATPTELPAPPPTAAPTDTNTPAPPPAATDTADPTEIPAPTATPTMTQATEPAPTSTNTPEPTRTAAATPDATETSTAPATAEATPTDTPPPTGTEAPATATPTAAPTDTAEPIPTDTEAPTPTQTAAPTDAAEPTPTDTEAPIPTHTAAPTDTAEPTPTATGTAPPTLTPTITMEPTPTPTPTATATLAPTNTATHTPTATATQTATPAATATATDTPTPTAIPTPLYVDADATAGNNDGSSWDDAHVDLQGALAAAPGSGVVEIWVAEGTYRPAGPGDRETSFQLLDGVGIYGGFIGGEATRGERDPATNVTILSGDLNGDDSSGGDNSENSYHVVTGGGTSATAVLDGFTITGGNADGSGSYLYGGGMYNEAGSPTVANCTFTGNSAALGGGMSNRAGSNATLTDCAFTANSSGWGAGIYNNASSPTLTACVFSNNEATTIGGGISNLGGSPTLTDCAFVGNSAPGKAGGVYNDSTMTPVLINCIFSGNTAGTGAGMYNHTSTSPTLTNCAFSGNVASSVGGGCGQRAQHHGSGADQLHPVGQQRRRRRGRVSPD